jgi:hypothetical protein
MFEREDDEIFFENRDVRQTKWDRLSDRDKWWSDRNKRARLLFILTKKVRECVDIRRRMCLYSKNDVRLFKAMCSYQHSIIIMI